MLEEVKRVLCIEDESFVSELYARALRKAGYDVTVFLDSDSGLRAAQSDKYDIILLDTSFGALNQLQNRPDRLKAKIIITTSTDQENGPQAEMKRMADGYIIRAGTTPGQLVQIINDIASGKQSNEGYSK